LTNWLLNKYQVYGCVGQMSVWQKKNDWTELFMFITCPNECWPNECWSNDCLQMIAKCPFGQMTTEQMTLGTIIVDQNDSWQNDCCKNVCWQNVLWLEVFRQKICWPNGSWPNCSWPNCSWPNGYFVVLRIVFQEWNKNIEHFNFTKCYDLSGSKLTKINNLQL